MVFKTQWTLWHRVKCQ